jgi:hypothetical protein
MQDNDFFQSVFEEQVVLVAQFIGPQQPRAYEGS